MTDIIEAGFPAILPQTLSFTIFMSCEIIALVLILWGFAAFLDRTPSRFAKIRSRKENLSPLEAFEIELARIVARPERAKVELPKLVRSFLETHSGIPDIHAKTLAEISEILPKTFSGVFSILEEIEYSRDSKFSEKQLQETVSRLQVLAQRLLTK